METKQQQGSIGQRRRDASLDMQHDQIEFVDVSQLMGPDNNESILEQEETCVQPFVGQTEAPVVSNVSKNQPIILYAIPKSLKIIPPQAEVQRASPNSANKDASSSSVKLPQNQPKKKANLWKTPSMFCQRAVNPKVICDCKPGCWKQMYLWCVFCDFTCYPQGPLMLKQHLQTHGLSIADIEITCKQALELKAKPVQDYYRVECIFCTYVGRQVVDLHLHVQQTHNVCNKCSVIVKANETHEHLKQQTVNQCPYCPYKSCKLNVLVAHIKLHKSQECSVCHTIYSSLNIGSKARKCLQCAYDTEMERVANLACKPVKISCVYCSFSSELPNHFYRHLVSVHNFRLGDAHIFTETCKTSNFPITSTDFECACCTQKLYSQHNLLNHVRTVHLICSACCGFVDAHEKHSFPPLCTSKYIQCPYCSFLSSDYTAMAYHRGLHNQKTCVSCQVKFLPFNVSNSRLDKCTDCTISLNILEDDHNKTKKHSATIAKSNEPEETLESNFTNIADKEREMVKTVEASATGNQNDVSLNDQNELHPIKVCEKCLLQHETKYEQNVCHSYFVLSCFICNLNNFTVTNLVKHINNCHALSPGISLQILIRNYLKHQQRFESDDTKRRLFHCAMCVFKTMTYKFFTHHVFNEHHICNYCCAGYNADLMDQHLQHNTCKSYICVKCSKEFMYKAAVLQHFATEHIYLQRAKYLMVNRQLSESFSCPYCKFESRKPSVIAYHLSLHSSFSCGMCTQKFIRFVLKAPAVKDLYCDSCFAKTHSAAAVPEAITSMIQKLPCLYCKDSCEDGIALIEHCSDNHSNFCLICNLEFSKIKDYIEHRKKIHIDCYLCWRCSETFLLASRAKDHMRIVHKCYKKPELLKRLKKDEKAIKTNSQCAYCLRYMASDTLLTHLQTIHKIIKCTTCACFTFAEVNGKSCARCVLTAAKNNISLTQTATSVSDAKGTPDVTENPSKQPAHTNTSNPADLPLPQTETLDSTYSSKSHLTEDSTCKNIPTSSAEQTKIIPENTNEQVCTTNSNVPEVSSHGTSSMEFEQCDVKPFEGFSIEIKEELMEYDVTKTALCESPCMPPITIKEEPVDPDITDNISCEDTSYQDDTFQSHNYLPPNSMQEETSIQQISSVKIKSEPNVPCITSIQNASASVQHKASTSQSPQKQSESQVMKIITDTRSCGTSKTPDGTTGFDIVLDSSFNNFIKSTWGTCSSKDMENLPFRVKNKKILIDSEICKPIKIESCFHTE